MLSVEQHGKRSCGGALRNLRNYELFELPRLGGEQSKSVFLRLQSTLVPIPDNLKIGPKSSKRIRKIGEMKVLADIKKI